MPSPGEQGDQQDTQPTQQATEGQGADQPLTVERVQSMIKASQRGRTAVAVSNVQMKGPGLQHQVDTLSSIDSLLANIEASVAPQQGILEGDEVLASAKLARDEIRERIKKLRIADEGGWKALQLYEGATHLGEDAADASNF